MRSPTRQIILRTLKKQGKCTVKTLAEAAGISPVSVRHHLASLQAENLLIVEETREGVGRPFHQYSLSENGVELFPRRYYRLTNRIIDEIKESMPEDTVRNLFSSIGSSLVEKHAARLSGLPFYERLQELVKLLTGEGFEAEFEIRGDEILIRELSCPYYRVGQSHPEICLIDEKFIAESLNVPVERVSCVLDGDNICTYSVHMTPQVEIELQMEES
ncbi:MAG: ArsR family transcriptional regulator [Chloroflexi bacterium]|nr:ArsR family transcriptional regulator [Chloroflexota bacterium]